MGTGTCFLRYCCVLGTLATATSVEGGLFNLNWGGNYVVGNQSFDQGLVTPPTPLQGNDSYIDPNYVHSGSSWYDGRLVSDSNVYGPQAVVGGQQKFYGGHVVQSKPPNGNGGGNGGGMSHLAVVDNNSNDYIHIDVNPSNSLERFAMLTYWKLPTMGTYKLDASSVFTLTTTQDSGPKTGGTSIDPGAHGIRWVVRNRFAGDEQFYVSKRMEFANSGVYSSTSSSWGWNLMQQDTWSLYDPEGTDLRNIFVGFQTPASPAPPTDPTLFTDVTGVGFYVEYNDKSNGAGAVHYKIQGFSATLDPNGNAVPEPSTFLLGLVGAGGVAFRRWRQRRKSSVAEPSAAADLSC